MSLNVATHAGSTPFVSQSWIGTPPRPQPDEHASGSSHSALIGAGAGAVLFGLGGLMIGAVKMDASPLAYMLGASINGALLGGISGCVVSDF
jgi:hypothetical protein